MRWLDTASDEAGETIQSGVQPPHSKDLTHLFLVKSMSSTNRRAIHEELGATATMVVPCRKNLLKNRYQSGPCLLSPAEAVFMTGFLPSEELNHGFHGLTRIRRSSNHRVTESTEKILNKEQYCIFFVVFSVSSVTLWLELLLIRVIPGSILLFRHRREQR
jgi:hypothetical protein